MSLIKQQGIIGTIVTRIKNRRKLFKFQDPFTPPLPSDLQVLVDAKANELIAKGYPQGIVSLGKKQVAGFAYGLAHTYSGDNPQVQQEILHNAVEHAVIPDGMFEDFVKNLSQVVNS